MRLTRHKEPRHLATPQLQQAIKLLQMTNLSYLSTSTNKCMIILGSHKAVETELLKHRSRWSDQT